MKKGKGRNNKLLPSSLRIISSCIKTVSTNASTVVRSAGASLAASISSSADDRKEQVLWAGFDKLELSPTSFRRLLLLGYQNGFQVFDVEDSTRLSELVSRREGPVTFLQMLPTPENCDGVEKCKSLPPMLVVVGGEKHESILRCGNTRPGPARYGLVESSFGSSYEPPTAVRFYSLKLNEYVKVFDFKSAVFMVRCSHRVVAVGLEEQIYCFDSLTLEKKFIVVTYPVPRIGEQGAVGISTGYGPIAVGPRWLAYPPNRPFHLNTGRLSQKNLASSACPSTSPGSGGSMMARYAVESSKHLASGILTLGDLGYKKLSKHCPELLPPDSPSPPGWKAGRLASCEPENAGVVVVKDLVSSEVISQFRAHTSPISALCFDPSGTLLVTASVHGNNINIFRIMPSHSCSGSGSSDWSTSSVHLYKLHRGITTAVIQDICFSNYSQWVAIISSKGTCHIFVLSPFGGDDSYQALKTHGQGDSLFFTSSPPWWSTSSFTTSEQNSLPAPTFTLAVVSRIKCSDSGLLNSVTNAASSAVGKVWAPSGAVAAIFHNSGSLNVQTRAGSLEHILVYAPSGFVVQHEIRPSIGSGPSERRTESWSAPQANLQNEEFTVKVEPVQWWDVCRRLDNLEREECVSGSIFDGQSDHEIDDNARTNIQEINSGRNKNIVQNNLLKLPERPHWYLSNSEVQINSCRLPIWQNSKIQFQVMKAPRKECSCGGEFEIEMASSCEVEIRHKYLLPIVDHFPRVTSGWIERSLPPEVRCPNILPSDSTRAGEKTNEASIIYHSKPPSFSSTESSGGGSSRQIENLLDLDHMNIDISPINICHSANDLSLEREEITNIKASLADQQSAHANADFVVDNTSLSGSSSSANENSSSNAVTLDSAAEILMPSGMEKEVDFEQFFNEGYCNMPNVLDHGSSTEVTTAEVENYDNAKCEGNPVEEGWIGEMFEFEGK